MSLLIDRFGLTCSFFGSCSSCLLSAFGFSALAVGGVGVVGFAFSLEQARAATASSASVVVFMASSVGGASNNTPRRVGRVVGRVRKKTRWPQDQGRCRAK